MTNPARTDRVWLYVGVGFLLFWVVVLRFYNPLRTPGARRLGGGNLGPADFSWKVRDLDGKPVELSSFRGRPVFLNLWATWCPPCVREMPSIARLAADPKLKGVAFVCVSLDTSDGVVKDFLRGKDWPMTVLRSPPEDVPRAYQTEGIPATFILAPDGTVASSEVGSAEWDDPEVVAFLAKLSNGAASK